MNSLNRKNDRRLIITRQTESRWPSISLTGLLTACTIMAVVFTLNHLWNIVIHVIQTGGAR